MKSDILKIGAIQIVFDYDNKDVRVQEAPMPQRVRFAIDSYTNLTNPAYRRLLNDSFGLVREEIPTNGAPFTIVCTTDQFAVFLIKRNDLGFQNGFKSLNPTLIDQPAKRAPAPSNKIDVTNRG